MATAQDPNVMSISKSSSFSDDRQRRYFEMKQASSFTDFVINTGEKEPSIKCHRMVLSAACPYFNSMFKSEMKESVSGSVNLAELDASAVSGLIDYCYTGELDVPWENVMKYLKAADYLLLLDLMPKFDRFIAEKIEPENCVGYLYNVADHYGLSDVKKKAEEVMLSKLSKVSKHEEFSQLTFSKVTDVVVKSIEKNVNSDDVLQSCIDWVLFDEEDRRQYFSNFLNQIKLHWCSAKFLRSILESYSKTLLNDISLYQKVNTILMTELDLIEVGVSKTIMILGGMDANDKLVNKVWKLNVDTGKCEEVMTHMFRYWSTVCMTSLGVLVAGGQTIVDDPTSAVNSCDLLQLKTLKWREMPNTARKMICVSAVSVDDQVFAIGGGTEGACGREKRMECFDLIDQLWYTCEDLLEEVRGPIVCAVGQIIYVLFNTDPANNDIELSNGITLQCYDVSSEQWSYGPTLPDSVTNTHGARATSLGHRFYVVGGKQKLCLCYDTRQKSWSNLQGPSQMHCYGSVVVMGNKLVLCCGTDSGVRLDSIESFDVKREEWRISQYKAPVPIWVTFCAVVD